MKKELLFITLFLILLSPSAWAKKFAGDYLSYAKSVADTEMARGYQETTYRENWNYKQAFLCNAYLKLFEATQDSVYYEYVKSMADSFLDERGVIKTYYPEAFDLRNVYGGNFLYDIYYHNRGGIKYLNAMASLRRQLHQHTRTQNRMFVFSQAHAGQVRIDGLYMAMPFYCLYASVFDEPKIFGDVVLQFSMLDRQTLDKATGLNYQAWDENKMAAWADKTTGTTSALFGQSIGFYMMALVDVLDYFPIDNEYRNEILKKLNRLAASLIKYQDSKSGMWYQVVDKPKDRNNFRESSSTAMYAYAIAKGVNNGYLPKKYRKAAQKAFKGLVNHSLEYNGETSIVTKATADAELDKGDGTFDFYIQLPQKNSEPNAVAAFILAAVELAK